MTGRKDPLRVALAAATFALFYYVISTFVVVPTLFWLGSGRGFLAAATFSILVSAALANWLSLRIYENRSLISIGLWWNRASLENLGFGVLGGFGSACAVLAPPLIVGAA